MTQSPAKSTCPHWVPIWVWPLKRNSERSAAEQLQILTQQGRGPTIYTAITAITQYHAVAVPRETTQKLIWKNHKNQMQILAMICWTNLLGKSGQVHMKSSHSEWLSESWGNAEGITTGSTWTMPAPVPSPCRSQALRAAACHDMEWLRWSTCPIFNRKFISTCSIFNSLQPSAFAKIEKLKLFSIAAGASIEAAWLKRLALANPAFRRRRFDRLDKVDSPRTAPWIRRDPQDVLGAAARRGRAWTAKQRIHPSDPSLGSNSSSIHPFIRIQFIVSKMIWKWYGNGWKFWLNLLPWKISKCGAKSKNSRNLVLQRGLMFDFSTLISW